MIRGNAICELQVKTGVEQNKIGEGVLKWETAVTLKGWLDLSGGDSKYTSYNAKIQESTHVFLSEYREIHEVTAENTRALINREVYDVMLIDDPMGLHQQLEIYLKYIGGQ